MLDSSGPSRSEFAHLSKEELWRLACDRQTAHTLRRAAIRYWLFLEESERSNRAGQVIKEAQQAGMAYQQREQKKLRTLRNPGESDLPA